MHKLSSVKIEPRQPVVPGTGVLIVQGWQGRSHDLEIAIVENQNEHSLQLDGSWQSKSCWFQCGFDKDEATGALRIDVGNFLINALLTSGSSVVAQLRMREAGNSASEACRVIMPNKSLLTASAAGVSDADRYVFPLPPGEGTSGKAGAASGDNTHDHHTQEQDGQGQNDDQAKKKDEQADKHQKAVPKDGAAQKPLQSKKWLWIGLIALVVVAAAAAAAWWFLRTPGTQSAATEPVVQAPAAQDASPSAAPCSVQAMGELDEMAFVQGCVAQSPSSQELLQTIQSAKETGKCGVAQRLAANRANAGDVEVAVAYAKEYDPQFHQASQCFEAPEIATAVYWWETILGFDAQHELAAQRLKELRP